MSRIYQNMKEAISEIQRDIYEMGIKVHPHTMQNKDVKDDERYETLELQNYSFCILDLSDKNSLVPVLEWCRAEFDERISPNTKNPGEAWKLRPEVWSEFLVDGRFCYTYSERMNAFEQVQNVIRELTVNPDSRQCIIHVHYPEDILIMRKKRMPCSIYYQLMVRRGELDIIYNMRSCDFNTHFRNDIWQASELRDYIAGELGIPPGRLYMNIGSLHVYKGYNNEHVF